MKPPSLRRSRLTLAAILLSVTVSIGAMPLSASASPRAAGVVPAAEAAASILVDYGAQWRALSTTAAPPQNWTASAAVSSEWGSGKAPVGFGSSVVGLRTPSGKGQVIYIVKAVSIPDISTIKELKVTARVDDGLRMFVNGAEFARSNVVSGDVTPSTRASSTGGGVQTFVVPGSKLRSGENLLAAEVRPNYTGTRTMLFDAKVESVAGAQGGAEVPPDGGDPGSGSVGEIDVAGWGKPSWADEFSGSSVDKSKWNVKTGTRLSFDESIIEASQVSVADGSLQIKTERLNKTQVLDGITRSFKTGYVESIGKFSRQYGRWEVRAYLPLTPGKSRGLWPAIWFRDAKGVGEVDLLEAIGDPHKQMKSHPAGVWTSAVHQSTNHESGTTKIERVHKGGPVVGNSWHTWVLERTPQRVTFAMDGNVAWTVEAKDYPWLNSTKSFTSSGLDMRINQQVGHSWMGYTDPAHPEETLLPAVMKVDYVRYWSYPGQ